MGKGLLAALVSALALATASCGGADVRTPDAAARQVVAGPPLLALVSSGTTARLQWLDRATLRAVASRGELAVGLHDFPWAFSPDRRRLVLGSGRTSSLVFVEVESLRRLGRLETEGFIAALVWPRPDVVLVVENLGQEWVRVAVVDPQVPTVRQRVVVASRASVLTAARVPDGLALLLGGAASLRPVELVVVTADGSLRRAVVDQIPGGFIGLERAEDGVVRFAHPALAVSPDGRRAVVLGGAGPVADIDLATMTIRYHALTSAASPLGRLRDWLEPQARADGGGHPVSGWERIARWLPAGILVTGSDTTPTSDGKGQHSRPAGLRLIDPDSWQERTIAHEFSFFMTGGGRAVATGNDTQPAILDLDSGEGISIGARLAGRGGMQFAGRYLYLGLEDEYRPHTVAIIDNEDGRVVARPRAPGWVSVVDPARPHLCWCYADP